MRATLAASPPFRSLPLALIERVIARSTERLFARGTTIIEQGSEGRALYVVAEGDVRVVRRGEAEALTLATVSRGGVLGEMALLTGEASTADVVAETDVRAVALPLEAFRALVAEHADLAIVLEHLVAERLGSSRGDGLGGKILNGYRVGRPLGRGGMAVVYEAEEVATGRRVALKMMSHRLARRPDAIERFEREGRVLRALDDPGIARLHGDFPAFGTRFLVLELVDGESLDRRLERDGELPLGEGLRLLARMADALAHVHAHRIAHRDLKPGNVMLANGGGVKLLDFGMAGTGAEGTIAGSALYMSPEQMEGKDSGPATDVYALGCLAIETLSGRPPFSGRTFDRLLEEKRDYVLPTAREIAPRLPQRVHAFLAQALSTDPALRPRADGAVFRSGAQRILARWGRGRDFQRKAATTPRVR